MWNCVSSVAKYLYDRLTREKMNMRTLILYFSGTGNTKDIACRFEKALLKRNISVEIHSIEDGADLANTQYDSLIIGFPKYYEYPVLHILNYIRKELPQQKRKIPTLAFCTQAGPLPTNFNGLSRLLDQKNHKLTVSKSFPYANNMMIFSSFKFTDPQKVAENKQNIQEQIEPLLGTWLSGQVSLEQVPAWQRPLFHLIASGCTKGMPVFAMRFSASQDCTHCGLCVKQCPMNNIRMTDDGPIFQKHCLFCMRCINACPTNAILYDNKQCQQYKCEPFSKE